MNVGDVFKFLDNKRQPSHSSSKFFDRLSESYIEIGANVFTFLSFKKNSYRKYDHNLTFTDGRQIYNVDALIENQHELRLCSISVMYAVSLS